jgi:hypothetical protein
MYARHYFIIANGEAWIRRPHGVKPKPYISVKKIENKIAMQQYRQTQPAAIQRPSIIRYLGNLGEQLGKVVFDEDRLSPHLTAMCADVPLGLETLSNRNNCHSPPV